MKNLSIAGFTEKT